MKYISFLSLFLIFSLIFTVSVSAIDEPSSSSDVSSDVPLKNGIIQDDDGKIRYYVDGEAIHAGLVYHEGYYYYFGSSLVAAMNEQKSISKDNGLLPFGTYTFDENGHMVDVPEVIVKNGIVKDNDGEIRYYVDGVATYAGLVFYNGYFYYFGSDLMAARNATRYISLHNDLLPYGQYQFDEFGHMVDVPEVEMNDLFYLERIYILLFIIVAFTVAGLFIARPRRWI